MMPGSRHGRAPEGVRREEVRQAGPHRQVEHHLRRQAVGRHRRCHGDREAGTVHDRPERIDRDTVDSSSTEGNNGTDK